MLPRDRQLAAIRREPADRVSLDAICIENIPQAIDYLGMEKPRPSGFAAEGGDGGYAHLQYLKYDLDPLFDRLGIDGRIIQPVYTGRTVVDAAGQPLSEWGTLLGTDFGKSHGYPLSNVAGVAQVERFPWPDTADYNYEFAASCARQWGAKYAIRGPYWKPLFCQVCALLGMEETLVKMVEEPAVFEALLDGVFRHVEDYCRRFLDACGDDLHILYLAEDFAGQRGLLMSPSLWRKWLKPRLAKLFELGKQRGKYVWFHSCGDITAVLPDLIDIGMDVWETVQLHALPMSPEKLKEEFGKHITFFGGINTQRLPFASPEEIRREVQARIEVLGRDGGYICGPDHHVKPDVPPENLLALFDAASGRTC
jgi:uroporphyrinogen decarboxylase